MPTNFEKAFAAARKGGKKEFSFGGKQYNTKLKGEGGGKATGSKKRKGVKLPKEGPVPAKKPNSGPGRKPTPKAAKATAVSGDSGVAAKASVTTRKRQDYPKPAQAVGIARKGSAMSKAKAKQENAPVAKKTKGLFLLGPRTKRYSER